MCVSLNSSLAQDAARERLEREAAEQAAQGDRLFKEGNFRAALGFFRAERVSRKMLGDARYEALALRGIGICLVEQGEFDEAVAALKQARDLDAGRDDKGFEGYDGLLIARAEMRRDDAEAAIIALDKALPKLDQAVDRDHECEARLCLAGARLRLAQADKAEPEVARALALAEDLDRITLLADAWMVSGEVAHELGELSLAFERFDDARAAYQELKQPARAAEAMRNLADLSFRLGPPQRAVARFESAIATFKELGDRMREARDRLDLAAIHFDIHQPKAAIDQAELARDLFVELGDNTAEIAAMLILAQAHASTREGQETAIAIVTEAIGKSRRVHREEPAETVRLMLLAGELERRFGHGKESAARLDEAEVLASKSGDPSLRAIVARARAQHAP